MVTCSVGIMAYNEEANIGFLLRSLSSQQLFNVEIKEIVVVASGCTDRTVEIVKAHSELGNRVLLLIENERKGKASAINLFLRNAQGEIVVLESADTIPAEDAIEKLIRPFREPAVGMTGARPVPVNPTDSFIGFTVHLYWCMHHEIALMKPKLGEMIAFRNIIREIPEDTAVDEASLEEAITKLGLRVEYAKDAVMHNRGAETIREYLRQRRRVVAGHKQLCTKRQYQVSTMKWSNLVRLLPKVAKEAGRRPLYAHWFLGALVLESLGRLLGNYDYYVRKENPFIWKVSQSTKRVKV